MLHYITMGLEDTPLYPHFSNDPSHSFGCNSHLNWLFDERVFPYIRISHCIYTDIRHDSSHSCDTAFSLLSGPVIAHWSQAGSPGGHSGVGSGNNINELAAFTNEFNGSARVKGRYVFCRLRRLRRSHPFRGDEPVCICGRISPTQFYCHLL